LAANASAQPAGPHHGAHAGLAGQGDFLAGALQRAHDQLNLNSSQQVAWDSAVAASKAAHEAMRTQHQRLHAALTAELAKPQPDFAAVAAIADDVAQQDRTLRVNARNAWLNVYANLSPEQKTTVRDLIATRLARMQEFRNKMRQGVQGG